MNNLLRVAFRANNCRSLLSSVRTVMSAKTSCQQRQITRNLWYMTNSRNHENLNDKLGTLCSCGCMSVKGAHTKAERELVEFLTEEILTERKASSSKTIPSELDGFKIQLNGSEVVFTKQGESETVKITFNVNHTVDADQEPEIHDNNDKPELGELKSRPSFRVDVTRGKTTLSLSCSFQEPGDQEEGYNDVFGLDELSVYDGEWNDNTYAVSGEIIDSYLYDLILNYLEEKGISNEFVEKLSSYSTQYEHTAYIGLLEGLSKFASGK